MRGAVLQVESAGLYCPAGGFHVDPALPVRTAVVTHAHSDHARAGSDVYYCAAPGAGVLRLRVGAGAEIRGIPYGERFTLGDARVSFHPAGHVLGSAQVRVECGGAVWVASGDYKRASDPTCEPFEVVKCDVFITEATFALPIYRWDAPEVTSAEMLGWWAENARNGRACVVFGYSLGKSQRIMAELARAAAARGVTLGPIYIHGALAALTEAYRAAGVALPPTSLMPEKFNRGSFGGSLTIAPPSAAGSLWMRRFGENDRYETASASGWMRVRGVRSRGGNDRGFVLSDHADWPGLLGTIRETGASRVLVTHGNSELLVRYLREIGIAADPLSTVYGASEED